MTQAPPKSGAPTPLFRGMPVPLVALFWAFLAVPIASLIWRGSPLAALHDKGLGTWILSVMAFAVLPVGIAYSLVRKHHWFIPLFTVLCASLIFLTLFSESHWPGGRRTCNYFLIALMIYPGLLFGNRNLLYPFLTEAARLWRRAPRFEIGRAVVLQGGATPWRVKAVLRDASLRGVSITVPSEEFRTILKDLTRGSKLAILVSADAGTGLPAFQLPTEIVWKAETKLGEGKIGCHALDGALMKTYLKAERTKKALQIQISDINDDFSLEQDIHKVAFTLWMIGLSLALAL